MRFKMRNALLLTLFLAGTSVFSDDTSETTTFDDLDAEDEKSANTTEMSSSDSNIHEVRMLPDPPPQQSADEMILRNGRQLFERYA